MNKAKHSNEASAPADKSAQVGAAEFAGQVRGLFGLDEPAPDCPLCGRECRQDESTAPAVWFCVSCGLDAGTAAAERRLEAFNDWWARGGDHAGDNKAVERLAWFAGYQFGKGQAPARAAADLQEKREVATVLAALRCWQQFDKLTPELLEIATSCGEHQPLLNEEIDALCERINS